MIAPRIVVLDGFTLNPGDLDWSELEALGPTVVHDRTPADQIVARAAGASIVLTNKTPLRRDTLEQLPDLRYIGVLATGFDVIDVACARERGIPVCNAAGYSTDSVAQVVFALLLELTHHVGLHDADVRTRWPASIDFAYTRTPLIELAGKSLGILGFGRIGARVAQIGKAMGMRIVTRGTTPREGADEVLPDFAQVARASDVLSLHCPLNDQTRGMIDRDFIAQMKPASLLINTGRGALLNEAHVAEALNTGRLGGAGLDVLSVEPPPADNPLLSARNCIITPHYAWASLESRRRLMTQVAGNIRAFLSGAAMNVVNR